ncbi:MAG TPA: FtsK/SpoIIIE domain-containing protein [Streptosporangiaceae bacterium]|nr:FtsK/SpoIIIE domain-containing protein [Streptosporangiaceae bacterium]
MVVINSGDQLPDLVVVLFFRALWRYRSELAPVTITCVMTLAAFIFHLTHPQWWPHVLAAAVVGACMMLAFGRRFGLSLPPERIYAATVTLTAGSWFAAGIAIGPTHAPLPTLLLSGGIVLAIPWWAHRRRRARVRVERTLAAWPDIAKALELAGSRVQSAVIDVWGWRARFGLARGQTIHDVIRKLPVIESAFGTFRGAVRVYPTPDDKANRFELRVLNIDPHSDAITWPGPSVTTITQAIDLGPFEDAAPAQVLLLRRHALIGGATGSGKSGGINVLLGNLVACRDVVVWGIDLKRGMELGPWASCIDRLATTPDQARALLRDAVTVLETRAALLATEGKRVWEPSPQRPALVIIIDEYAELADDAPDAIANADSIARLGRAIAVTLIAATQRPTQKAMGKGAVRSQMDIRISFRVRERADVDLILGQGMREAGWHAHTLNAPGKFLLSAPEHDTPRRARAYLLTDDAVTETARRYAHTRPTLDNVSQHAITEANTTHTRPTPETPSQRPAHASDPNQGLGAERDPEAILWTMLTAAPAEGIPVSHLINATGMGRSWVYYRLQEMAEDGRAERTNRGRWRARPAPRTAHGHGHDS